MKSINRRDALCSAAGTFILSSIAGAGHSGAQTQEKGKNTVSDMPLGIISKISDPDTDIARVREIGFGTCQMTVDDYSEQHAMNIKESLKKHDVKPTSLICMGPGPYKWNFYEGPSTIGLIPRRYRAERIERLKTGIEFCRISGIPAVLAHFGFKGHITIEREISGSRQIEDILKAKACLESLIAST